jgi:hypothetical protein
MKKNNHLIKIEKGFEDLMQKWWKKINKKMYLCVVGQKNDGSRRKSKKAKKKFWVREKKEN